MLAVLLESQSGNGLIAYGPFDDDSADRGVAERFAAYLTAEVDPARVVPASEVHASERPVRWYSAIRELLAWYEHTTEKTVAAPRPVQGQGAAETAPTQ